MGQDSVAKEFGSISFEAHSLFCTEALIKILARWQMWKHGAVLNVTVSET